MTKNKFHGSKGQNPALRQAILEKNIEARLKEYYKKGIAKGCLGFEVMTLMILNDKFGMSVEDQQKYVELMNDLADSMEMDYLNVTDIVKALHDENGFTMSEDKLIEIDPSLAAYCTPSEE